MHFNTKLIPLENPYKPINKKDLHVSFTKTSRSRYIILTILGEKREKAASLFYNRTILLIKLDKDCRQRKLKANFISDHLCLKQNFCIHPQQGNFLPSMSPGTEKASGGQDGAMSLPSYLGSVKAFWNLLKMQNSPWP